MQKQTQQNFVHIVFINLKLTDHFNEGQRDTGIYNWVQKEVLESDVLKNDW